MAEETQQEKEARWAAYRASQNAHFQTYRADRKRTRLRNVVTGAAFVAILALIVALLVL